MPHTLQDQISQHLKAVSLGVHEQPREKVDDEGIKTISVTFIVEIRPLEGPIEGPWGSFDRSDWTGDDIFENEVPTAELAACAVDIPNTGEFFRDIEGIGGIGYSGSRYGHFRCLPGYDARPYKADKGEQARFWLVTRKYSTSDGDLHVKNPRWTNRSNNADYLNTNSDSNENAVIGGGISKISRPMRNSYAALPIKDFQGNANDSAELMRQVSYMTVTIDKTFKELEYTNQLTAGTFMLPSGSDIQLSSLDQKYFGLRASGAGQLAGILSFALNKVNHAWMWGFPPRHVRFEDVTWDRLFDSSGQSYLKASMTFKIAPPWVTQIPSNNPVSRYRSSYGFDEPQIILSNRFLNRGMFIRPPDSQLDEGEQDPWLFDSSSGTYDGSTGQIGEPDLLYIRPMPALFKIPSAGTYYPLGKDILANPETYTSAAEADQYKAGRTAVPTFDKVYVPSLGWLDWSKAFTDDVDDVLRSVRGSSANPSPNPTPIEVLSLWSTLVWNPMTYYDTTNLVFDYSNHQEPNAGDPMKIERTDRIFFADALTSDQSAEPNYTWVTSNEQPSCYRYKQDGRNIWTSQIPGMSDEFNERIAEQGHPIWVNTVATTYNFEKWPGFPYVPGQDMSEMLVYPAVDAAFDFGLLDLPSP